ncbi:MAG: site-2 protease family protein [Coriobacteriaceae bacterium]|nr:site-2 protease family protein [Coriobacteriaceae bacterium]
MDAVIGFIAPIFWGLVVLSVLVFVHEGGHFLAARACGVRVLEFFLGMPCRIQLSRTSKRIGTKFGITPLLLGGYAEICGMDPTKVPCAPRVLTSIHRHGVSTVDEIASELELSVQEVQDACITLYNWGSIVPRESGYESRPDGFPAAFASVPRDAAGNTVYDGKAFDRAHATAEGDPWEPPMGEIAFYNLERSHTYLGVGFWRRAFMLIAGIAVNIVCGFLLVVSVYSVVGVETVRDVNVIGSIEPDMPAEAAGLNPGDRILKVNDAQTNTWVEVVEAIDGSPEGKPLSLSVWRPSDASDTYDHLANDNNAGSDSWLKEHGSFHAIEVSLTKDGMLGINASVQTARLNPIDSCRIAADNIAATAVNIARLLNPSHTMEILDNSTSVVGISVMSAQAAAAGPATFLNFAAMISFSLGFMNLLPIPPLDGGKLVIEVIQAVTKREVPLKVQSAVSIAGIVLFGLLFIYMLRADILRFFL